MPVGGDVIQLTHKMAYGSQDILNVYYFEAVDGSADLDVLAAWFNTNVVPDIKAAQVPGISHASLDLINLYDTGEVYELALSGNGTMAAGDGFASFYAAAVRFPHATADLRDGFKRYGVPNETYAAGNQWTAGYITLLEDIADHLINPIAPALPTWAHVIVGRVKVIDMVTETYTYRLPETQSEGRLGYPVSYEVSPYCTSQNTRKQRASV